MLLNSTPTGILLTNLGTPAAPTTKAVRKYLAEFLSDPRVVEIYRPLWWLILHAAILPTRPKRSAELYQSIWTDEGSPLLHLTKNLGAALEKRLRHEQSPHCHVAVGMRYGKPSLADALKELRQKNIKRLIILPLYPQYASATLGSTIVAVNNIIEKWRWIPPIHYVFGYPDNNTYIRSLVNSIQAHWKKNKKGQILLFSFHGIPKRSTKLGDPYEEQCNQTAQLIANELKLKNSEWEVVFQSRFGKTEWLQPYCDRTLKELPKRGYRNVDVVCPGFAVDCLETLQEIADENKRIFLQAGGESFYYIPALNDTIEHVDVLMNVIGNL